MFCPQCGKENVDEAQFCVQCGNALKQADTAPAQPQQQTASAPVPPPAPSQQPQQPSSLHISSPQYLFNLNPFPLRQQPTPMTKQDETLRLINFILCILSCIAICWAVIPLAWAIPMTVHSWGIYKGTKPNTTAFGVCTLIFVNIIGGILLLISNKDDK